MRVKENESTKRSIKVVEDKSREDHNTKRDKDAWRNAFDEL